MPLPGLRYFLAFFAFFCFAFYTPFRTVKSAFSYSHFIHRPIRTFAFSHFAFYTCPITDAILQIFFTLSPVNNTRGHSAKVLKNCCSLDLRRFFFSERVVDRWNSLPQHMIDSGSINAFKNGLNTMRREEMGFFMDWLVRLALRPHMFLRILWNRCGRTWYLVRWVTACRR